MKITQLMLSRGFGGAERYFVDLILALQQRGHQVQVICHPGFIGRKLLENAGAPEPESFAVMGWWDIYHQRKIGRALARYRPDIVHAHLARGAYIAGKVCHRLQLPLVVKTHNYVNLKYYTNVNHFIATTCDQKNFLLSRGINESAISVVPNFSSVPIAKAGAITGNNLRFATYGRLVRKKGMHVLLHSFRRFLDDGKEATLHIGGDGPELGKLKELTDELKLQRHVYFHGWIDNPPDFISRHDVMVLPSLDEPFGIVVLEIMAGGKPLIATRTAGPMEILDETSACLVDPGDDAALFKAMKLVAENPGQAVLQAQAAQKLFIEHYSEQAVVPEIINIYDRTIRHYAASHPAAIGQ